MLKPFVPALLLWLCTASLPGQNVLLFTVDSCRADRLGAYGNDRGLTPNIDRWAATGTVFRNAYSTSAWTVPGLVSILTGLHPPTHSINNRDRVGSPQLQTLIKLFRNRGYLVPNLNFFSFAPYYQNLGLPEVQREYFGETEGEELLNWLREKVNGDSDQPFFLWYHSALAHQPYHPGADRLPAPEEELKQSPGIRAIMTGAIVPVGSTEFSPSDRPVLNALYDAEVRRVDELFGKALDLLGSRSALGQTLIILTADHGEELLDHGFVGHASTSLQARLYEEIVRIPLIISWPGHVPEGQLVDRLVNQMDIFPTVTRLFDMEAPQDIQGTDLFASSGERPLFFESVIAGNQTTREREHLWIRAIRKGRYKFISTGELYDLVADPNEQNDIASEKSSLVRELSAELDLWLTRTLAEHEKLFPAAPERFSSTAAGECPRIHTPQNKSILEYDLHTGALLFDWSGDIETSYVVEYHIGKGDHHVSGSYEVQGNHQVLGPFPRELWGSLKAWNPFRIRVSPKIETPCWSRWIEFRF